MDEGAEVFGGFIVLVILICVLVFIGKSVVSRISCTTLEHQIEMKTEYRTFGGCFVETPSGQTVPKDSIRLDVESGKVVEED